MKGIILFSGMDFSGKSSTAKALMKLNPGKYTYQEKFLTPIKTLQHMIDNDIWIPPKEEFIPLLINLTKKDISDFEMPQNTVLLQDTIWSIKYVARLCVFNCGDYTEEIETLMSLIKKYPQCESYYFTTTIEERRKRYKTREAEGKRISNTDRFIFDSTLFNEIEEKYKELVIELFPNTKTVDTTNNTANHIAKMIDDIGYGEH